ncbi:secreted RxLR effector protein 161-like [Pyrus communis]|uniref:secreted RxLR effector protein 161-like n=1 Tax=Pyrus communis TaxID=23211 RepID=UPI0035BFB526
MPIRAVYVDINLIGTPTELEEIVVHLKSKYEMKDLGKTRYCVDLEIEHCLDGILEDEEEILEPKVPYLSAIGALLYLAQYTKPNISFDVNLLAKYSNAPTRKHWNGVKDIFCYLKGTMDLDAGYLSNPHIVGDTAISWRFTKKTLVATSSNHAEIFALHEASRECFWLRAVMEHN